MMKRNNVAKQIGIASLCLATAISAFSGLTFFNKNISFSSEAKNENVALTDLLTVSEGATIAQDLETTAKNAKGLRISSDVAYEATFNTVFNGNSVFKFRFPETYDSTLSYYGDFKFHIADITDPDNCFDIIYYARATSQTAVYVQWKDQIRTTVSGLPSGNVYTNNLSEVDTTAYAPFFLSQGKSTYGTHVGIMALVWNNGVLGVQQRNVESVLASARIAVKQWNDER